MRLETVLMIANECGFPLGKENVHGETIVTSPENVYDLTKMLTEVISRAEYYAKHEAFDQAKKVCSQRAEKSGDIADLLYREINSLKVKVKMK